MPFRYIRKNRMNGFIFLEFDCTSSNIARAYKKKRNTKAYFTAVVARQQYIFSKLAIQVLMNEIAARII